jgi:hypothetical protein
LLLSVINKVPDAGPMYTGPKVTLIVQEPEAATLLPQLFAWLNIGGIAMLVVVSGALPVLLSVTGCGALEVPTH